MGQMPVFINVPVYIPAFARTHCVYPRLVETSLGRWLPTVMVYPSADTIPNDRCYCCCYQQYQ